MDQTDSQSLYTKFEHNLKTQRCQKIVLQNLKRKINEIKFLPYSLHAITQNKATREIVIQQNEFLEGAKMLPLFGIIPPNR